MKMKKVLAMILMVAMVFTLAACGGSTDSGGTDSGSADGGSTDSESADSGSTNSGSTDKENAAEVSFAYEMAVGEPGDTGVNAAKEALEESGFTVNAYPNGQLGSKDDVIDQILAGENLITVADPLYLGEYVGDLSILYGPMLFDDMEQALNFMENSTWLREKNEELAKKGLRIIGFNWIYGDRVITTKTEVTDPSQLKGMKIRVNSNDIQIETFKALETAPTAMALTEVYSALQSGAVDGFENTYSTMYNQGFYEVCPYIYDAPIVCAVSLWICGEEFYQSLTEEQQDALLDAMVKGADANNTQMNEESADYLQNMIDAGTKVYEPSDEEFEALKEQLSSVYTNEAVTSHWADKELYNTIQEEIENLNK